MKKYKFHLLKTNLLLFEEKDHIILATSLTDAIQKFVRKHDLEMPVYWDEPIYETYLELFLKSKQGYLHYHISWE